MPRVLVTGGTGALGREIVTRLLAAGYTTRIMSRQPRSASAPASAEWAQADVMTGQGLADAVANVDVIINAASNPLKDTYQTDVEGAKKLLEQARTAHVGHVIHVSIVGIERIPYQYYKYKVMAEDAVKSGGVPWSIQRATQFHGLLHFWIFRSLMRIPLIMPLPTDFKFQLVDPGEVADELVRRAGMPPAGQLPDFGGPQVQMLGDIAKIWLRTLGIKRVIVPFYWPGKIGYGFRHGFNTCPDHPQGKIGWAQWLGKQDKNLR